MFWLLTSLSSTAYGGDLEYPYLLQRDLFSHKGINGTVLGIKSDLVFFKTEKGTKRSFGMKEMDREGIPSPPLPGDEVSLILDRGNSIIDVTEAGGKGGFFGNEVTGMVLSFDGPEKMITLKTEEGEVQGFLLKDAATTKLNKIEEEERTVTLALDGEGRVMDVYRPE
jgi:hypothetical protein